MNVRDIKTKARSMIATNRSSIVMIFLFIGIMMVAINYLIELIGSSIPKSEASGLRKTMS